MSVTDDTTRKRHKFEIDTYELMSFQIVAGYVAVLADRDDAGETTLSFMAVDGIGLARKVTQFVEGYVGECYDTETHAREVTTEMVGVWLEGGYWKIINEVTNFAGLCRAGDDIYEATGCLSYSVFPRRPVRPSG